MTGGRCAAARVEIKIWGCCASGPKCLRRMFLASETSGPRSPKDWKVTLSSSIELNSGRDLMRHSPSQSSWASPRTQGREHSLTH